MYATEGSAAADLFACTAEDITLQPSERAYIPTGLAMEPEPGYFAVVCARSGMASRRGLAMSNGIGVIDNDYTSTSGYLGLWPGYVNNTNVYDIYPDYIIPDDSPLLRYYNFGGYKRVAQVKHWNGPYFE